MNAQSTARQSPEQVIVRSLRQAGILPDGQEASFEALSGGVSSDIWKVTTRDRIFCVKRALAKLKVEADWFAPVERNRYEVAWYRVACKIVPGAAPQVIAHDEDVMLCAMEYLDGENHTLWKNELRDGRADPQQAAAVGSRLGRIHAGTAGDKGVERMFPHNDIFHAIRLEPYLEATAQNHPDLKDQLFALSRRTEKIRLAMIHGDVSPKNILIGPNGPVILDAECACIGDPAFDLAFCLNHFLLKCLWTPGHQKDFLACYTAMTESYLATVDWEPVQLLEARAASLLPGLFLARVDGKSPAEYINEEKDKDKIRRVARAFLISPPDQLSDITIAWNKELSI